MKVTTVEQNRNRDLMDPNFAGYKLSLDSLAVTRSALENGPVHILPSPDMFSFLHVKMFGEHNHLTIDTYNENIFYFISVSGCVYCVGEEGTPTKVYSLPDLGRDRSYNPALVFASPELALLSDGTGTLLIMETGNRKDEGTWKVLFQDEVCGKDRPFEVRYGVVQGEELEVILQYVEDKDKVDGAALPSQGSGESSFLNVLEWITFGRGDRGWRMDRVRRLVSHGGYNYVGITGGSIAVSAEKKTMMVFDSLHPEEAALHMEEEKKEEDETAHFYWRQTNEDLELWAYVLPDMPKTSVKLDVSADRLEVRLAGSVLLQGSFLQPVEQDSWTWTLDGGKLGLMMTKKTPGPWSSFWNAEGGAKGVEVTETSEDTVLAHLTSETPVSTGEPNLEPAFNAQELESVDDAMDENSQLIWQVEAGSQQAASLAGQQHLMVIPQTGASPPALCIRHDVDGAVWRIQEGAMEHVINFPALGYVQAGKQSRKFMVAPATFSYSAICDASRHVYIYRQAKALSGSELKNRKTGVTVAGVAVQQVVTLENTEEILGIQASHQLIVVVTPHSLYRIRVN